MNSIFIAMFVFICGLVVLLMYQSSRIMQMQEDLKNQLDAIHKCTLDGLGIQLKHQEKIGNQIERDIDIFTVSLLSFLPFMLSSLFLICLAVLMTARISIQAVTARDYGFVRHMYYSLLYLRLSRNVCNEPQCIQHNRN